MGIRRKSRELVVQTIYALSYLYIDGFISHHDYIHKYKEILDDLSVENEIDFTNSIYKFAEKILQGLLPRFDSLDKIINKHIEEYDPEKIGLLEYIILRLAVFEMCYNDTPAPVIINEAVELCKKYCAEKSPALINAVLDKIKEKEL